MTPGLASDFHIQKALTVLCHVMPGEVWERWIVAAVKLSALLWPLKGPESDHLSKALQSTFQETLKHVVLSLSKFRFYIYFIHKFFCRHIPHSVPVRLHVIDNEFPPHPLLWSTLKKIMLCLHVYLCSTHMMSLHVDAGNPGPLKEQVLLNHWANTLLLLIVIPRLWYLEMGLIFVALGIWFSVSVVFFTVLGIGPNASYMPGKHSQTGLPRPNFSVAYLYLDY